MALYGRDLLLPLIRHLDGTSGRRWSKSGPLTGQARTALFPTSADTGSLTSKPDPDASGWLCWRLCLSVDRLVRRAFPVAAASRKDRRKFRPSVCQLAEGDHPRLLRWPKIQPREPEV